MAGPSAQQHPISAYLMGAKVVVYVKLLKAERLRVISGVFSQAGNKDLRSLW